MYKILRKSLVNDFYSNYTSHMKMIDQIELNGYLAAKDSQEQIEEYEEIMRDHWSGKYEE